MKARELHAEIFTASAATARPDVAELREFNRHRDRLIRNLRRVYQHVGGSVLPAGLAIEFFKWAARQPRSYDLQRRAQIDADGRQKHAADGKPASTKILEWRDRETSDGWSTAVIDLVRRAHPDALDGGRG